MPAAEAVEALILEYGKLVFHTIYGLTGDWEESQDLTQETFHQALRSIDAATPPSASSESSPTIRLRESVINFVSRVLAVFLYHQSSYLLPS